jgi:pimeloyl-ACP methyl ester carboxylesterase
MHLFYLHGFASSPASSKARFFADRCAALGRTVSCPDLNAPDFSTLTTTRMITQVESAIAALPPAPVGIIGSSLGAFVAWHLAARQTTPHPNPLPASGERGTAAATHPITRLVLLAPAFDFGRVGIPGFGAEELRQWREAGSRRFFHHADNEPRDVHYGLYEDAQLYSSDAVDVSVPALVFQGSRDELVDATRVRAFAASRPSITLRELDDDHQLHASIDTIWNETVAFLGLARKT